MNLDDVLVFDTEATTYEKGAPFSKSNELMCIGYLFNGECGYLSIGHSGLPYGHHLEYFTQLLSRARLVVGFNLKYDLHWIKRYIPTIDFPPVWDVQYGEFLLSHQLESYPSLDGTLLKYGLPLKIDLIKTKYWDQGLDTRDATEEELKEYVLGDVNGTAQAYLKQVEDFPDEKKQLMRLHMMDLLVLEQAEVNGMLFDENKCRELANETESTIVSLTERLREMVPDPFINWNSYHHLSAILYGGSINYDSTETVTKQFKKGPKEITRKCVRAKEFPRLVKPLDDTELDGTAKYTDEVLADLNKIKTLERKPLLFRTYSTSEDTLRMLRASGLAAQIIEVVLELSNVEKLHGTYYEGLPKLVAKMQWDRGMLHGGFNQCVAITGRLSSSKPNLQNFDGRIKSLFYSRFT